MRPCSKYNRRTMC